MNDHGSLPPDAQDAPGAVVVPYSAAKMFLELESPPGAWRERHGRIQAAFVRSIDPLIAIFLRSGGRGTGEGHFAIRQVTVRAINDLVVAVHLALHGYLNQSYNSLRMAIEGMSCGISCPRRLARRPNGSTLTNHIGTSRRELFGTG